MKNSLTLILAFSLLILTSSLAQLASYNFDGYRQANTTYRGFSIDPALSGSHTSYTPSFLDQKEVDNVSAFIDGRYFNFQNQEDFKKSILIRLDLIPKFESDDNGTIESQRKSNLTRLFLELGKENYKDYNKSFWGYSLRIFGGHGWGHEKQKNHGVDRLDRTSVNLSLNSSISLRYGWGRMENITNAWHAYRILNRMNYTQISTEDYSTEKINALGQFLDELKTERIFDDRLRNTIQMQWLDSQLREEYGISNNTIKYFTELNDMWVYGISENRIKGQKAYFDAGVAWKYKNNEDKYVSDNRRNRVVAEKNLGPWVKWTFSKGIPVKRDQQFNYNISLYSDYLIGDSEYDNAVKKNEYWSIAPHVDFLYGFYPTTRTEWELRAGYSSEWRGGKNKNTGIIIESDRLDRLSSDLVFRYYIRTTTSLSGRFGASYQSDALTLIGLSNPIFLVPPNWQVNYSLGFNHIFM